jgi:hypothetical protein
VLPAEHPCRTCGYRLGRINDKHRNTNRETRGKTPVQERNSTADEPRPVPDARPSAYPPGVALSPGATSHSDCRSTTSCRGRCTPQRTIHIFHMSTKAWWLRMLLTELSQSSDHYRAQRHRVTRTGPRLHTFIKMQYRCPRGCMLAPKCWCFSLGLGASRRNERTLSILLCGSIILARPLNLRLEPGSVSLD